MSTLGLTIGLLGAFVGIFGSLSSSSYAAPAWFWSIVGTYNPQHIP